MQPESYERLERMRLRHDAKGRFFRHPRVPEEYERIKAKVGRREGDDHAGTTTGEDGRERVCLHWE